MVRWGLITRMSHAITSFRTGVGGEGKTGELNWRSDRPLRARQDRRELGRLGQVHPVRGAWPVEIGRDARAHISVGVQPGNQNLGCSCSQGPHQEAEEAFRCSRSTIGISLIASASGCFDETADNQHPVLRKPSAQDPSRMAGRAEDAAFDRPGLSEGIASVHVDNARSCRGAPAAKTSHLRLRA
jgi:hypothetical protein